MNLPSKYWIVRLNYFVINICITIITIIRTRIRNSRRLVDHDDVMHFIIESCGDVNVCGWIVISSLRPYPTCSIREGSNMTHTHIRSFTHQLIMLLGPLGVCVCVCLCVRTAQCVQWYRQTHTHVRRNYDGQTLSAGVLSWLFFGLALSPPPNADDDKLCEFECATIHFQCT